MKKIEIILVVVITVIVTLGSLYGYNRYQEYKDPNKHVQAIAADLVDQLKILNDGIGKLYDYQTANKMKAKKQIAIIVPEEMLKPATSAGVIKKK